MSNDLTNQLEIMKWLEKRGMPKNDYYGKPNYLIDPKTKEVQLFTDFAITDQNLERIPIKFSKIHGNFQIRGTKLKTLENMPKEVSGILTIDWNSELESLKGFPEKVGHCFVHDNRNLFRNYPDLKEKADFDSVKHSIHTKSIKEERTLLNDSINETTTKPKPKIKFKI